MSDNDQGAHHNELQPLDVNSRARQCLFDVMVFNLLRFERSDSWSRRMGRDDILLIVEAKGSPPLAWLHVGGEDELRV